MKGDGRVFRRGAFWWVSYYHHGKELREAARQLRTGRKLQATADERLQAEKFLKHRLGEIAAEHHGGHAFTGPRAERLTVANLVDGLEADFKLRGKDSPQNLSNLARVRADFGGQKALSVTAERVDKYIEDRLKEGYRPASINRTLQLLNQCYSLAIERKSLNDRPVIRHLSEKGNERRGFFEAAEFKTVVENLPDYLQDFARFGYLTGWRKGEAASLCWSDVEGDLIHLRPENAKNGHARSVPIEGELVELVDRRRQARVVKKSGTVTLAERVFHRDGLPIGDIRKSWQRACCLAGVGRIVCRKCGETVDAVRRCPKCEVTWKAEQLEYKGKLYHDLRRTSVRDQVRAGVPETVAMSISGHRTRAVFDRYNITDANDQRAALRATQTYRQERESAAKTVAVN